MWEELLIESGLNEREVRSIMILGSNPKMKASELAKELNTTRLDAYNSLSRLQEMGIVNIQNNSNYGNSNIILREI